MSETARASPGAVTARLAARGLAVLTLINLFNYLDRFVVASLVESLRDSELRLTDTQSGALMTGFIVVYMVASPFFGVLGDKGSRPRLLALGVFVWSLATAAAGLAKSFASLFAARAAVGIGEAAYGTIAPSLLADYFSKEKRGRVYAIFFCAIPIGSALGYIVGGYADTHLGWRSAFFVAGLPGLLLAFLALTLPDPPRGASDEGEARARGRLARRPAGARTSPSRRTGRSASPSSATRPTPSASAAWPSGCPRSSSGSAASRRRRRRSSSASSSSSRGSSGPSRAASWATPS